MTYEQIMSTHKRANSQVSRHGVNNRHDGSYKQLFSHPEMVASLIRDFVPEDWVEELDFSSLENTNKSFITDDIRDRHDDIIWRVRWQGS
jgi:predicted transposase YdaD